MQGTLFGAGPSRDSNAAEELATLSSATLHDALVAVVRAGWMFSISSSRDGFSLRLAVLRDGERDQVWCEDAASAEKALHGLQASATAFVAGESIPRVVDGHKGTKRKQ